MSIRCRKAVKPQSVENPYPMVNMVAVPTEEGTELMPADPVAPSQAVDFDVVQNSLYRGAKGAAYRVSVDPVDFEGHVANLLNDED